MKYTGEEKKVPLTPISIGRLLLLLLLPIIAFGLAFYPILLVNFFIIQYLNFGVIINLLIISLLLVINLLLFIFTAMLSTAFFINILFLKYKEGEYGKSLKDRTAFRYFSYFTLKHPVYKLLDIFNISPLKSLYLKLIGCKIGKNVFLAGGEYIIDPCALEIGENTMIGGKTIITSHLAEDKFIVKKVKIGKNCLIGGASLILPGVIIEDNVVVGARSLIIKDQLLKKGKTYAGIPAKEIKKKVK